MNERIIRSWKIGCIEGETCLIDDRLVVRINRNKETRNRYVIGVEEKTRMFLEANPHSIYELEHLYYKLDCKCSYREYKKRMMNAIFRKITVKERYMEEGTMTMRNKTSSYLESRNTFKVFQDEIGQIYIADRNYGGDVK